MKNLNLISRFRNIEKGSSHHLTRELLLVLCILIIGTGAGYTFLNMPGWLISDGDEYFWQSQFYEAEVAYQRSLMLSPLAGQRSQAYVRLCRLFGEQSQYEAALAACKAAVQADDASAQAQVESARVYALMGRNEKARQYASHALEMDGENASAAALYGQVLADEAAVSKNKDFSQAASFCDYALMLDDSNADVYRAMGYINQLQGDYGEAASYFRQALDLRPDFAGYYIDLGFAETKRNDISSAMEAFDSAIELLPESAQALKGRGWGAWTQGDYQQARQDFKQALLLNEDSDSWAGLGWTYYYDGGAGLAQNAFEQALDLNPENASAISGLEVMRSSSSQPGQLTAEMDHESASVSVVQRTIASQQVIDSAILAAVKVMAFDNSFEVKSSCSGMIVSPDGHILTNLHCIRDNDSQLPYNEQWMTGIAVIDDLRQPPVQRYRAQMVAMDDGLDVVLLQIISDWSGSSLPAALNLKSVKIGDSDALRVGDTVWAAGFPGMGGDTLTLTQGMVSGFAVQDNLSWVKTDLMTGPGNSGGMVVNAAGELIGIHAQSWLDQGVSSSRLSAELPVNYLGNLLQVVE